MQKLIFIVVLIGVVFSCGKGNSDEKILLDSTGNINEVSVVIDNESWKGSVGEAIRAVLASPVYGLPQDEPMFSINQIPTNVFSGFITKNRTILKVEVGEKTATEFYNNVYAKPQKVILVSGKTKQDVINQLEENASRIIETFNKKIVVQRVIFKRKNRT